MTMESSNLPQSSNTDQQNGKGPFPEALVVFFHIDATDINSKITEICQIAAWYKGKQFREFILPDGEIHYVCRMEKHYSKDENGKLFLRQNEVNALSPKDGLQEFINFLRSLTEKKCNILLAAYNCKKLHRHVIVRLLKQYNLLQEFKSLVLGFIDTMAVFRSQQKTFFSSEWGKHALIYVEGLVAFIEEIKCDDTKMKRHVDLLDEYILFLDFKDDFEDILKEDQLRKMAKAGISTNILKDAYSADKDNGVANLLKQGKDGKPVVKLTNDTIKEINNRVSELCAKHENSNITA